VKNNQVKLLGSNAPHRSAQAPNVPAIAEVIPGFDFSPTIGVFAAKGTPASAIERISTEIAYLAKQPEVIQLLNNAGIDPIGAGPADFDKAIQDEIERLGKAIATAGIKSE
jgi:tripartite-type tricarboxylate transporter receptor subunit TctC